MEAAKSTLDAVYVSPPLVPTVAPVDLVVSLPLRKSPTVPSIRVQLGLIKHHLELWAGLQRCSSDDDCTQRNGRDAGDLAPRLHSFKLNTDADPS